MKILHLAPPAQSTGGLTAHSFIDEEIRALSDAGVECWIVSDVPGTDTPGDRVRVVRTGTPSSGRVARTVGFGWRIAREVPLAAVQQPADLFHALRIEETAAALVARQGVDAIHSHFGWPGGFGGALASARTGVPLVASLRGMDLLRRDEIGYGLRQDPLYERALARLLRRAARTVYATRFMQEAGLLAGAPADRAVVVTKGVDLQRFRPARGASARRALDVEGGGPLVLAAGGLAPRKGYQDLLSALGQLTDLPWTLAICGDGPERGRLERLAATLGIGRRVHFAGAVSRDVMADYFAAADIFVHAAVLEAAGNVILEALASGCAVIATDSGGPPEHLIPGRTGLIVPPQDPRAIAEALRTMLASPERRIALATEARRDAEARFSYGRMIGDLIDVYRRVRRASAAPAIGLEAKRDLARLVVPAPLAQAAPPRFGDGEDLLLPAAAVREQQQAVDEHP